MRPLYETEKHLEAEKAFIKDIEVRRNVRVLKLGINWKVDAICLKKNLPIAWMEIKIRQISLSTFPTIILSSKKINSGLKLCRHLWQPVLTNPKPLKFLFLIRCLDGDWFTELTEEAVSQYDVTIKGGRTSQTRDEYDIEPVVHIPTTAFKPL